MVLLINLEYEMKIILTIMCKAIFHLEKRSKIGVKDLFIVEH